MTEHKPAVADPSGLDALLSPDIDPAFWVPERIGLASAWWGHVPFAFWLVMAARPRLLVELGTHNGISYAAFCDAVLRGKLGTRCHAVDTWAGDEHAGRYGEQVYADLRGFHDQRYGAFSELLRSTFDAALPHFEDGSIDLLHIDGYHTYEAVRHDFESWRSKLSNRAVVLFHDTNVRGDDFGVYRFFGEISKQFPSFEFSHSHGLGVLAVGAEAPVLVRRLCELASDRDIAAVRERFAHLGARWSAAARESLTFQDLSRQLQEADLRLADADRRLSEADAQSRSDREAGRARAAEAEIDRHRMLEAYRSADTARRETQEALRRAEERSQDVTAAMQRAWTAEKEAAWRRRKMRKPVFRARETWEKAVRFPRELSRRLRGKPKRKPKPPAVLPGGEATALRSVAHRFEAVDRAAPLRHFMVEGAEPRVTVMTDSVSAGSFFGGVATALLLGVHLARRKGARLRVLTRTEPPVPAALRTILDVNGESFDGIADFEFVHFRDVAHEAACGQDELFLTTSWWTTASARAALPTKNILYLIQEDERMFYPQSHDQLLCVEAISDPEIRYVVNTRLLFDHFGQSGLGNITGNGMAFEPAFSNSTFFMEDGKADKHVRDFFFYARPRHVRNLYDRGVEVINAALERGVLDPAQWRFHFVGSHLEEVTLARGVQPLLHQGLDWTEYARLARQADLGLSLMYTPHPSYPPLDLAASGAVCVTNAYGLKQSLDRYSRNILCTDIGVDSLVAELQRGAALTADFAERRRRYDAMTINRRWSDSFAPVLDWLD
jgi:hypothetical protein